MQWIGNRLAALNKGRVFSLAFLRLHWLAAPVRWERVSGLAFFVFGGMGEHLESVLKPRALGLPRVEWMDGLHILSSRLFDVLNENENSTF
jgi:hypothetical protein